MNEISIAQAVTTLSSHWWWLLPAAVCLAVNAAWIGSIVCGICYEYVMREAAPWCCSEMLVKRLFPNVEYDNSNDRYMWKKGDFKKPWYYLDLGGSGYREMSAYTCWWVVGGLWPVMLVFPICIILHVLPIFFMYAAGSLWAFMFTARLAVDAGKKARSVLKRLEEHEKDPKAHTES